nr:TOBE domain-containing protein [Bacillus sp. FJAT-45037]
MSVPLCEGDERKEGLVTAVIRPEHVTLSVAKEHNALEARVETVSFLGERYEISLSLTDSKYTMFAYSHQRLSVGQTIFVQIDTSNIHVMTNEGGIVHEKA